MVLPASDAKRPPLAEQRLRTLKKLGALSERVLSRASPIRPTERGLEIFLWPGHALGEIALVRRSESVVLATSGISDPWDPTLHPDPPGFTFGFEFALEVPLARIDDAREEAIAESWMPTFLWALSDWIVAERIDVKARLVHHGCLTLTALPVAGLEHLRASNGFHGVLLGIPYVGDTLGVEAVLARHDDGDDVWLLPIKLLTPDEYEWAMEVEDSSRAKRLAQAFLDHGQRHLSWPSRPSILPGVDPSAAEAARSGRRRSWWPF